MTPSCAACRFGEPVVGDDEPYLICRLNPPVMILVDNEPLRIDTQVAETDWCSHYTPEQ